MKVLIITTTFFPDVGGVETMLMNFCHYLGREKIFTDLITYNPLMVKEKAPKKEMINSYVTVWRIPHVSYGLFNYFEHYIIFQFFYLVPVLTIFVTKFLALKNRQYDLIHSFGMTGAFAGGVASKFFKIPCLVDLCTVYRFPKRAFLSYFAKKILNWSSLIRANSPVGRDEILSLGISEAKVGMITPPVDEKYFRPLSKKSVRKKLKLSPEKFIALFVGRMVESKNVEIAVQATGLLKGEDLSFIFIGEGPLQNLVEKAATEDSRILFVGNVSHKDLLDYYNAADILMCVAVDSKLLSFVGREALMCGLPILFPDSAAYFGISYKVEKDLVPEKCGRRFNLSSKGLGNVLEKLIDEKRKNKEILSFNSQECRDFAVKKFSGLSMGWLGDSYDKTKENWEKRGNI